MWLVHEKTETKKINCLRCKRGAKRDRSIVCFSLIEHIYYYFKDCFFNSKIGNRFFSTTVVIKSASKEGGRVKEGGWESMGWVLDGLVYD